MLIDPFRLCIALWPLAIYCLLLGLINLSHRPLLTTGARDLAALGVALSGLAVVGPLELFMPEAAAARFGQYVWLLLLAFYGLGVTFLVLLLRPRLVIYNISAEELRPAMAHVIAALDPGARWAGDSLALPALGVQLHLENYPAMRHVSLIASGLPQNVRGWRQLERALGGALVRVRVPSNPRAIGLITGAILTLAGCLCYMLLHPQALAEGYRDMLRL
jgi:hypothetical protein